MQHFPGIFPPGRCRQLEDHLWGAKGGFVTMWICKTWWLKHLKYIMIFQNCGIQIIPKLMILHTTWWFVSMFPAIMVLWCSLTIGIRQNPTREVFREPVIHTPTGFLRAGYPCSTIEHGNISPYFTINHRSGRVRAMFFMAGIGNWYCSQVQ